MANEIQVMIVDDSALMRNLITRMIEATPGLVVAERAMNGIFALQKLERSHPDVIVLDLEMPQMNGIEFLQERNRRGIDIPVIILSSIARKGAEITMEALALGASDFIMKPSDTNSADIKEVADQLTKLIVVYGRQYRQKKGLQTPTVPEEASPLSLHPLEPKTTSNKIVKPTIVPGAKPGPIEIIAIGISTGGPNALREIFPKLDKDLPAPILVVQHMPPGFTTEFAKSLDNLCPLEVKEAAEGDIIKPGRILIAPGDKHLEVEKRPLATVAHLSDAPPVNGHRPSADILFASVAKEFGNRALGVIMTGMGRDGAKELGSILRSGGLTIGQDEVTSIVYGMPKVAWELGHVMEQVPLSKMAERINNLTKEYQ
ncbi:MAG: chemotaxis response regulator protein-glutamate methylesterase [Termitinemataceae bacterium]